MLFTAHVNIAALVEQIQRQAGKNHKTDNNFPHLQSPEKRPSSSGDEGTSFDIQSSVQHTFIKVRALANARADKTPQSLA